MEECKRFIESKREKRHFQTKQSQIGKFNRLQQQKLYQNKGGCSKQHVYQDKNCPTNGITKENNLDTNSNNSNQSNNERDHKTNQIERLEIQIRTKTKIRKKTMTTNGYMELIQYPPN